MMLEESVDIKQRLLRRVLIAAFIVFAQDLSSGGGAQAWTYSNSTRPNRRWLEARRWCQQHFTDMVVIQNQEESDFLNKLLPFHQNYYWIGLTKSNGSWIRVGTNEEVPEEAQNWAPKEPDDIPGQDCVEIYIKRKADTAKWNNENCRKKKGTVCYTESCTQDSCSANADCVETIGSYTCRCHPGFMGSRCEEAIACKPLLDPEQGFSNCFDPFGSSRFNSSCRFHCELGFQLVGVPQLLCQASGQWNNPVPLCQAEQCPVLNDTNISAGSMNCSHPIAPYSYNSTCKVRCDEGYESSGPDQICCDHTGQWTASIPTCTVVQCNSLKTPPNASIHCQDPIGEHSFSSVCTVICQEGYDLIGTNMTKCSSEGNWSHPLPVCQVKRCNPIKPLPHGSRSCSDPNGHFSFGSRCTSSCDEGFLLNGTASAECNSLGMWSAEIPHCSAQRCPTLKSPSHGSLVCSDPHGQFSFGSRCTSACDEGFLLNGTANSECNSLGVWSADIPHCSAQRCPALKSPSHGSLVCSDPHGQFSFGSRCTSACDEGFLLNGTANSECNSLGVWSADIPHCSAQRCPALKSPSHGSLVCSDPHGQFSFGSRCTSACEEGFLLNGTANCECNSLGMWSADIPHCSAQRCPALKSPSHGSLVCSDPHGQFSFGSRCTSACDEGFVLNEAADTECTSLGTWSRELPGCHAHHCPLLVKAPQHGRMNCSHPHSPFSYGSSCHFECDEGFWLGGSPTMICSSSGHWTQDLPTCQPVQCKAIHALSSRLTMNCSHPLGNFSFGSQCLFICREGFSLNGTGALLCSSTGFWNASLPECTVEDMPTGAAMLMYTGVGAASVVVPLVLAGLGLLIIMRFRKRENPIMSDSATWEEQENPAFEF